MTTEATTETKPEDNPQDPASPTNVDDTLPVKTEDTLGETKPEGEQTQPNQGGDPAEETPPVKDDDPTTPEPVDLSDENQQVAVLVEEAGLTPKDLRAAMEANGGIVPVAAMKALVEKHGEGVAAVMKTSLGEMYKAGERVRETAEKALYGNFEKQFEGAAEGSGKEHFENAKAWAQENMSKEERIGITELLQSGSTMVRDLGIEKLATAYQNADSYTQAADLVQGDNLATNAVQGLSKAAYQEEVSKLMDKGYSYESQEVKALRNRRNAAIKRGQ